MISPSVFLIFQNFDFLGWEGQRAKNHPKWQRTLFVVPYISGAIHHMIFMYGTHVLKDNISRFFYFFSQISIFGVNSVVKGQKMAQNDKKVCLLHSISQEAYIIWLWFLAHMCKIMIYPAFFFFFLFLRGVGGRGRGARGGEGIVKVEKITHNYQ